MNLSRMASALIIAGAVAVLPGCGGGGDSTPPPPPPPPPPAATLQVNPATLPAMTRGNPVTIDLSVNATSGTGTSPLTWQASGLPAGLSLQVLSPGIEAHITGTPTTAGTANVSVTVTDSAAISTTKTYSATVDSRFVITTSELPPAVVGRFYDVTLTAANGSGGLNWSTTFLPPGLSLNSSTGNISGTPTTPSGGFMNVTVSDSASPAQQANTSLGLAVASQLAFSGSTTITARRSEPLFVTIGTSGGVAPLTFTLIGGTLPRGIGLSIDGDLEGVARETGTPNVQIRVADSATPPQEISQNFSVQLREKTLAIAEKALPKAVVGQAYSYHFASNGGVNPIVWSSSNPTIVPGLTFLDGILSGTPAAPGTYTLNVSAQDSGSPPDPSSGSYSVSVIPATVGRNDSIATARTISAGTFDGSFSPYSTAPPAETDAPDTDYYQMTAAADKEVSIAVTETDPSSLIVTDPVVEVLRGDGSRFNSCKDDSDSSDLTPTAFDDMCLNDDQVAGVIRNSFLVFRNTTGSPVTFYIHVLDWTGDARPELRYTLTITTLN